MLKSTWPGSRRSCKADVKMWLNDYLKKKKKHSSEWKAVAGCAPRQVVIFTPFVPHPRASYSGRQTERQMENLLELHPVKCKHAHRQLTRPIAVRCHCACHCHQLHFVFMKMPKVLSCWRVTGALTSIYGLFKQTLLKKLINFWCLVNALQMTLNH